MANGEVRSIIVESSALFAAIRTIDRVDKFSMDYAMDWLKALDAPRLQTLAQSGVKVFTPL